MPDGAHGGMLESLCKDAVKDDGAAKCVDEFLKCVMERISSPPKPTAKAWMHAWLASRQEPDKRLGEAANAGYLPWNSPAFSELATFLRQL